MNHITHITTKFETLYTPIKSPEIKDEQYKKEFILNSINFYAIPTFFFLNLLAFLQSSLYNTSIFITMTLLQVVMAGVFLSYCKNDFHIYKVINTFLLLVPGPILLIMSEDNLQFSITLAFIIPNYVLLLFQDKILTLVSFATQMIFFNIYYAPMLSHRMPNNFDFDQKATFSSLQLDTWNLVTVANILMGFGTLYIHNHSAHHVQEVRRNSQNLLKLHKICMLKFTREIRNLVSSILSNLQMVSTECSNPKAKRHLGVAKACGEILLQLTNNMSYDAKKDTGRLVVNQIPTRLSELLEKIWNTSCDLINSKGLKGQLMIYKKVPPYLLLEGYFVSQIFLNLIKNAVRFTNKGTISASVTWVAGKEINDKTFEPIPYDSNDEGLFEKENMFNSLCRSTVRSENANFPIYILDTNQKKVPDTQLRISQNEAKEGILKIIVSDTGYGMSKANMVELFDTMPELFEEKIQDSKAVRGFTMWTTHQICKNLNGEIRAYSKENHGTTFIVCIKTEMPCKTDLNESFVEGEHLEKNYAISPRDVQLRALVVDTNYYSADTVKEIFIEDKVDVVGCLTNHAEVVNLFKKEANEGRTAHLMTIDLDNQQLDAKEMCREIRKYEAQNNLDPITIIIIVGSNLEPDIEDYLDSQGDIRIDHLFRKPLYLPEFQKVDLAIRTRCAENYRAPFHPKKVLLVDDDPFKIDLLKIVLTRNKYEFLTAINGKQAVDVYQKNWQDIGVIFMDYEMPGMNGPDATREIRNIQAKSRLPKIKIIAVTGHAEEEYEKKCKDAGMDEMLMIPFSTDKFMKVVVDSLSRYHNDN